MDSPNRGINVRQMISIFENQSFSSPPETKTERPGLTRAKSMGQLSKKTIYKSSENLYAKPTTTLERVELQITKLNEKLSKYWVYSKESHINYQNELLGVLTDIVNVESNEDPAVVNKKKQLIDIVKQLNKTLNSRLPAEIKEKAATSTLTIRLPPTPQPVQKLPPQITREVSIDRNRQISIEKEPNFDTVDEAPSVRKLRDLFEKKSAENNGLNVLVEEKTPKSFSAFNATGGGFKYALYSERATPTGSFVVAEDPSKQNGIVHGASIHREKLVHLEKLKAIFDNVDERETNFETSSFENSGDESKFDDLTELETESPPSSLQSSGSLTTEDESQV